MKKLIYVMAVLAALVTFSACSGSDSDNEPSLSNQFMYAGDSVKVGKRVSVDNKFVAYVSQKGYLHAFHVAETPIVSMVLKLKLSLEADIKLSIL